MAKNQANYEYQSKEFNENEQKPIKNFNEFSDTEEQEVKERAEKRLADRRKKKEELKINCFINTNFFQIFNCK